MNLKSKIDNVVTLFRVSQVDQTKKSQPANQPELKKI